MVGKPASGAGPTIITHQDGLPIAGDTTSPTTYWIVCVLRFDNDDLGFVIFIMSMVFDNDETDGPKIYIFLPAEWKNRLACRLSS
jgi:hypothetical protein